MSEPLLNIKPSSTSPILYHISEVLFSGIMIILVSNFMIRSGMDTSSSKEINSSILTSIAFCILEFVTLLAVQILFKFAKDGADIYFSYGFVFYLVSLIFFILEASTFYGQVLLDPTAYPYQPTMPPNNYQVVIEVTLRVGIFFVLFVMIFKK